MLVVLLHALPFDGRMWQAELDLFPGDTLAPSLYRFGATLESWAHGVLALAGHEPLVVVGCSVGGSCALEVARAAPDQVLGIVLVGAKAGVRPDPSLRDEALHLLAGEGMEAAWPAYWRPRPGSPPGRTGGSTSFPIVATTSTSNAPASSTTCSPTRSAASPRTATGNDPVSNCLPAGESLVGDPLVFTLTDGTRWTYEHTSTEIVGPGALHIVDQTPDRTATLFACHPKGSNAQRIVAHFRLTTHLPP